MASRGEQIVEFEAVDKSYGNRVILRQFSMALSPGEILWIQGDSGSGKSTVMRLAAFLSEPTSGSIRFRGQQVSQKAASKLRRSSIGVVFQNSNLFPHLSVGDNIRVAASRQLVDQEIKGLLAPWGLANLLGEQAIHISGGEAQRVAICRALVNGPEVILADEPTAGLDNAQRDAVYEMFSTLKDRGCAVLLASHDHAASAIADRAIQVGGRS